MDILIFSNQTFETMKTPKKIKIDEPGSFDKISQMIHQQYPTQKFLLYLNFSIPFVSLDIRTYSQILEKSFDSIYIVFETNEDFLHLPLKIKSLFLSLSRYLLELDNVFFFDTLLNLTGFSPILLNAFYDFNEELTCNHIFVFYKAYILRKTPEIFSLDEQSQISEILLFFATFTTIKTIPIQNEFIELKEEQKQALKLTKNARRFLFIYPIQPNITLEQLNVKVNPFPTYTPLQVVFFTKPAIISIPEQFMLYIPDEQLPFYYNPLTRDDIPPDNCIVQTLISLAKLRNNDFIINTTKVNQVISLVFDMSLHSSQLLKDGTIKLYLTQFFTNIHQFRASTIAGIVTYNTKSTIVTFPAPLSNNFPKVINQFTSHKDAFLWDGLFTGIMEIIAANIKPESLEYPNARQRIVLFTTGIDQGSKHTFQEIKKLILENKILLDIIFLSNLPNIINNKDNINENQNINNNQDDILLSQKQNIESLRDLSHITGGLAFMKPDPQTIFAEPFVNLETRNMEVRIQGENDFDIEAPSKFSTKGGSNQSSISPDVLSCITKELKKAIKYDQNVIKVSTEMNDISKWTIAMKGPDGSPYEKKWFRLTAIFKNYMLNHIEGSFTPFF